MLKNKFLFLLLIINILFTFSSCSYLSYKNYYTDISDYSKIKDLTGLNNENCDTLSLFPNEIKNVEVKDFLCRYDEQLPLGEGFQILLQVQYSDSSLFDNELKRISSLAKKNDDYFSISKLTSYCKYIGENTSSEYALIDNNSQMIYYVYLQNVPKEEIEFDHKLLPDGYRDYGNVINH